MKENIIKKIRRYRKELEILEALLIMLNEVMNNDGETSDDSSESDNDSLQTGDIELLSDDE